MISIFKSRRVAQDESHVKNLILMAKSDNSIDTTEVEVIIQIGKERGFSEEEVKEFLRSTERSKLIPPDDNRDKFDQIFDLTLVMLADDVVEEDELEFVTGFAHKLGFRKTSSAFIVTRILEGLEKKLGKNQIYETATRFMNTKLA